MTKRMLIDDTHEEETRVVILNGNKIEDVEFETSSRKQIKGNVYLAKVMRVEPSLQAAFVDYGGNKHGFLAFSEIHPDYYNISEEVMKEIDKEVNEAIEAKKQAVKEREEYLQKQKEEKQKKQAEEQAKREAGAEDKKEESPVSAEAEEDKAEENKKSEKKRLAKKKLKQKQAVKKEDPKVLAADNEIEEASVSRECPVVREEPEAIHAEEITHSTAEEYIDDDDDEDEGTEQDFEIQRKLLKVRKLYHRSNIQDVIKEGQVLLIQVVKEERGNKGAALTTYLSLAGRYCVLMPNRIKSGGVSRKITNMSDRRKLKSIIRELPMTADMSMIVRTAGEDKTKPDIVRDYNYLMRSWNQIRLNSLQNQAPSLVHEEGNLIKRALRDMYTKEVSEIIVDGDRAYNTAREFIKILSPHNLKKLKTSKKGDIPLFQRFQVETQLDKLHDTNVQLDSGGYLVINPTEALVAIDVNSGRATKEKDLEETALKTNLEAADEIAKQLRMRNLAGLIVIDFIDMDEPKNNQAVEKRLKEAMKTDRARIQIGKMSCFGLLEISRQRMHSSFFESNYRTCPHCQGKGIVRTVESSAVLILRMMEEEGGKNRSSRLNIYVPGNIAIYLLNDKRNKITDLEKRYNMSIIICADDSIKNIADYRIERIKLTKSQSSAVEKEVVAEPEAEEKPAEEHKAEEYKQDEQRRDDNNRRHNNNRRNNRRNRRNHDRGDRQNHQQRHERENKEAPHNKSKSEAVILYNSHGDNPGQDNQDPSKKGTWWRKLIS